MLYCYIFLGVTILAAVHAYTYARWLKQHDNKAAAIGVILLFMAALGMRIYRMIMREL